MVPSLVSAREGKNAYLTSTSLVRPPVLLKHVNSPSNGNYFNYSYNLKNPNVSAQMWTEDDLLPVQNAFP